MKTYNERTESIKSKVKIKRKQRAVIFASAATACVLLVLTVVCSLPILGESVPNINAYKNDEYYPLIQKLNSKYQDNKYSIFESLGNSLSGSNKDDVEEGPSFNDSSSSGGKYEETTLNQENGVIEADLLKRSTTHAFYLSNAYFKGESPCLKVDVYKLDGNNTEKVAEHIIRAEDGTSFSQYSAYIDGEMFLNDDATRLTVIAPCISQQKIVYTVIVSVDVSDVSNITEVNRIYVSGRYLSSRKTDGKIIVITNFNVGRYGYYGYGEIDYDRKETYVPQCGENPLDSYISMNSIYVPENCGQSAYTVIALLDETTLDVIDSEAVFSYSQDVYVSQDYVAVMRNSYYYYDGKFKYGEELSSVNDAKNAIQSHVCETVVLKYDECIERVGEIGVDGYIKDRYSMSEKDGVLRMFVTFNNRAVYNYNDNRARDVAPSTSVSLYCIDLTAMQIISSVEQFAPRGEQVMSARFDGDNAYVCTAVRNTDPVFFFDLSNLADIKYTDTGTIPGFSVSLVKFNDLLLGIGQGDSNVTLKIELYSQTDSAEAENKVISVAKYERFATFSSEYKSHFVNAEYNLVGLQIYDHDELTTNKPNATRNKYLLLRYNEVDSRFETVCLEDFDCASNLARAFYNDNGVYVFGTNGFKYIAL